MTELLESGGLREVGSLAVWSVTSAKPGNGVQLLRDDRDDTYWQSDGARRGAHVCACVYVFEIQRERP